MARPSPDRPAQEPEDEQPADEHDESGSAAASSTYGVVTVTRMRKDDGRALIIYARADGRP